MKIDGYYTDKNLLVFECIPVLTPNNRDLLVASSAFCFTSLHEMDFKFKEICKRSL